MSSTMSFILFFTLLGSLAANPRIPRQSNFGFPGSNDNNDNFGSFGNPTNNFGPNWGAGEPWGQFNRPNGGDRPPFGAGQPPIVGGGPSFDGNDSQGFPDFGAAQPADNSDTTIAAPPQIFHNPPSGCSCPRTRQFNPVCGSDGNTYSNIALLNCFKSCGTDVSMRYSGNCRRSG